MMFSECLEQDKYYFQRPKHVEKEDEKANMRIWAPNWSAARWKQWFHLRTLAALCRLMVAARAYFTDEIVALWSKLKCTSVVFNKPNGFCCRVIQRSLFCKAFSWRYKYNCNIMNNVINNCVRTLVQMTNFIMLRDTSIHLVCSQKLFLIIV